MNNDVLLAIPFFTFMGLILERSGMAEDLLDTIGQLFGAIPGGLAYGVMLFGALLPPPAAVVAGSVRSLGLLWLLLIWLYVSVRLLAPGGGTARGACSRS